MKHTSQLYLKTYPLKKDLAPYNHLDLGNLRPKLARTSKLGCPPSSASFDFAMSTTWQSTQNHPKHLPLIPPGSESTTPLTYPTPKPGHRGSNSCYGCSVGGHSHRKYTQFRAPYLCDKHVDFIAQHYPNIEKVFLIVPHFPRPEVGEMQTVKSVSAGRNGSKLRGIF